MGFIGIVAEYAPFHRGHAYQLERAKALSGNGDILVVMSGCFLQRGEAVPLDPFTRAAAAISSGADLVVQLPVWTSLSPAGDFAAGAVRLLRRLGAEGISFGAETADPDLLRAGARFLREEPAKFREAVQRALDKGVSYPEALRQAAAECSPEFAPLLHRSNNILALEYLRTMEEIGWEGAVYPVERVGSPHAGGTELPERGYASAASLRRAMAEGRDIAKWLPETEAAQAQREAYREPEDPVLLLREKYLMRVPVPADAGEGLENRLAKEVARGTSMTGILQAAATRRYTEARLRRCVWQVLLDMTPEDRQLLRREQPLYGRLLAASPRGLEHLAALPTETREAVVIQPAGFRPENAAARGWELDLRAWGLYGVLTQRSLDWHFRERLYTSAC
ncbi:MAG: nucleotidyltransferase family protein [Christensenellales bacterium]|jgi:predicted nucleotidyltransferase